ncbi:MAG: VWA domain-containing protein, partial [bacterium]|nr:VWA domain-containing protein [bacterium]
MKNLRSNGTIAIAWLLAHLLGLPAGAEQSPWPTIFRGSAEVNVINVEVVVTDAEGRPVTGLGRDDFELIENGNPVEISNFYAVAAGSIIAPADAGETRPSASPELAPPADQRPLQLILYVDNANLSAINRSRLLSDLRGFLRASWRPDMQVMLVTNDRSLVVRQDFTSVPDEIFTALAEVEATAPVSPRFDLDRRHLIRAMEEVNVEAATGLFDAKDSNEKGFLEAQAVGMARPILNQIRAYSEQRLNHVRESFRILDELIETAAALHGPKTVIYISDGLPLQPGAALYEAYSRRFALLSD